MASTGFKRPMTAQEAVLGEIRRSILTGARRPGTPIRQDAVAAELGVSRVPVREALKILEGEGQVSYVPHKGYVVRELDAAELTEVYRLREILEAEAIRQAVPELTEQHLVEMHDAMVHMESLDPTDLAALSEGNRRFHGALFSAASSMPRLQHFVRLLRDSADAYRALLYADAHTLEQTCGEHRRIHAACRAGDVEAVVALHEQHRSHTLDLVMSRLEDPAGQS